MSVSVVVLNWARPSWLRRLVLPLLARHPLVDEIVVSHGRADTRFAWTSRHADVVHRDDEALNAEYGVALRFVAAEGCRNDAVLLVDDDLVVSRRAIAALKAAWDDRPLTLHGIIGRRVDAHYQYRYGRVRTGEAPIVLTRCLMMDRSYARTFLDAAPSAAHLITRGEPRWNGEDIFLSLLSIRRTRALPRAHDLPFWNIPRISREGIKSLPVPDGTQGRLGHRAYRKWFTREAAMLLGVERELDAWLERVGA